MDSGPGAGAPSRNDKGCPTPLSATLKTLIRSAWDDGAPLLLATSGPRGPAVAPKGSMIADDDARLAWWERSKKGVLENLSHDARVRITDADVMVRRV